MATETVSSNWGAVGVFSLSGQAGLGAKGTLYVFRNSDTGESYLFALIDLGFGLSLGFKLSQYIRTVYKAILSNKNLADPASYTPIPVNVPYSADDLHFAQGAEASVGAVVGVLAASTTAILAWPLFRGEPQPGEVNNDYFSGAQIQSSTDLGLSLGGS